MLVAMTIAVDASTTTTTTTAAPRRKNINKEYLVLLLVLIERDEWLCSQSFIDLSHFNRASRVTDWNIGWTGTGSLIGNAIKDYILIAKDWEP
jgi:hypothetical protein